MTILFLINLWACAQENTSKVKENTVQQEVTTVNYQKKAEALITAIDTNQPSTTVLSKSEALTEEALTLLPGLIEKYPNCKAYLTAVLKIGPTLKDLPLEEIESGYHKDGKLPKTPSGECYHGKDLVVHPATVSALAKKGLEDPKERIQAKEEITEVLGHLKELNTNH